MKPKRSKKNAAVNMPEGKWIDVDELVKQGESKEIAEGFWVVNTMVVLDPPEPIKKPGKTKSKKK